MNRIALASLAVLAALLCSPAEAQTSIVDAIDGPPVQRWWKGNPHSHAMILFPIPHGDTKPKKLARWYRDRGYNFLCISDHNKVGRERRAKSIETREFILISGSEVTSDSRIRLLYKWRNKNAPKVVIHTTALNIAPDKFDTSIWRAFSPTSTTVDILRTHRAATENALGFSIVNHPNFKASISAQDIIDSGIGFFEVYNAYPHAKNHGGGSKPSTEAIWDEVLSQGVVLYGVASDDAHHTRKWSRKIKEELEIHAPPGGGWIMVRSTQLSPATIASAMKLGDFYATNGVHLSKLEVTTTGLTVGIDLQKTPAEVAKDYVSKPAPPSTSGQAENTPRITFITQSGRVVRTVDAPEATVNFSEVSNYVRAKAEWVSGGKAFSAWTQPIFTGR